MPHAWIGEGHVRELVGIGAGPPFRTDPSLRAIVEVQLELVRRAKQVDDTVTIEVIVPAGTKVITATGSGYKGVRADRKTKATVAEWQVARLLPNDKQSYSITFSKAVESEHIKGSIHWAMRGGRPAGPKDFVEIGGEEKKEPEAGGRGAAPTPPTQ